MKNVEISINGNIATITVDLSKTYGPSSSGKSIIVASSEGNQRLGNDVYLGINIYKKS